ncbi:hypothetical protein PR048_027708 [Dryococelus australis]|uniref:Uncharacterized protein n=1 Tax=Dryococelus australis TaxID=614101 RepID=A0ABQ9GHA2_9NEOP|nr:hypothetical protein PR048_027708 [Dryococelus australis]
MELLHVTIQLEPWHELKQAALRFLKGPRWFSGQTTYIPPTRFEFDYRWDCPRIFACWNSRRVFSGVSCFLRCCIPALLHTHLNHPHRLSKTSLVREVPEKTHLHDYHLQKSGVNRLGIEPQFTFVGGEQSYRSATAAPEKLEVIVNGLYLIFMISTLASHQSKPGSIPGRVTGFLPVVSVPDNAIGRRVFSGISRFPAPSFRRRTIFTSIILIGSQDIAAKSRPNLFTHFTHNFAV